MPGRASSTGYTWTWRRYPDGASAVRLVNQTGYLS
jgi:hypothetical protein